MPEAARGQPPARVLSVRDSETEADARTHAQAGLPEGALEEALALDIRGRRQIIAGTHEILVRRTAVVLRVDVVRQDRGLVVDGGFALDVQSPDLLVVEGNEQVGIDLVTAEGAASRNARRPAVRAGTGDARLVVGDRGADAETANIDAGPVDLRAGSLGVEIFDVAVEDVAVISETAGLALEIVDEAADGHVVLLEAGVGQGDRVVSKSSGSRERDGKGEKGGFHGVSSKIWALRFALRVAMRGEWRGNGRDDRGFWEEGKKGGEV